MKVIHVSLVNMAPGIATQNQSITPLAGTSSSGPSIMISGWTSQPPVGHCLSGGTSFASPSGAPPSAHATNLSISPCFKERSFVKWPYWGSADQGGILRDATADLMALAQGRTSL